METNTTTHAMPLKELSLVEIGSAAKDMIKCLNALTEKVAKGLKLTQEDHARYAKLNSKILGSLLCLVPGTSSYDRDNAMAQEEVQAFIKDLLLDEDLSVGIHKALAAGEASCKNCELTWSASVSMSETCAVDISVPYLILEDAGLHQRLLDWLEENVRYNLDQSPETYNHDTYDSDRELR